MNYMKNMENKVRVSCASFASIKMGDDYLLCLNKSQLSKGYQVFTPFGGALEYDKEARVFLDNIGVEYERKEPDLRLFMEKDNINLFEIWFSKKSNREFSVDREMIEEMVDEEGVFSSLSKEDYASEYIKSEKIKTDREGFENFMYFDIFKIKFNISKAREIFLSMENKPNIRLISKDEILSGETTDGIKIGTNSKSIII